MRRAILIVVLAAFARGAGAAVLREIDGLVQIRPADLQRWMPAGGLPRSLSPGDALRTGFSARATIGLDGGAALELGGGAQISVEEAVHGTVVVNLISGAARVSARALGGRALELRAPTAVARARSEAVAWRETVDAGGREVIEVEEGLVAVEDSRGGALRLRAGERVEVDLAGLHEATSAPTPARARLEDFAGRMRRELALDREADAVQSFVSGEMRRGEYEQGHILTDASGRQVRAEEFVVRSSPTSFTFVALNQRRGEGLSYDSWSGVFDVALPRNLAPVFAILPGSAGAPAPWTLTAYTQTISNGVDSLVSSASGGHQVDLNHNADPTDDVSVLFDPSNDAFSGVAAGRAVFRVLFDLYGLYSDGVLKNGWTGTNIQSQSEAVAVPGLPVFTTNTTFPDADAARRVVLSSYSDGTSITQDDRAVAPGGGVVARAAVGGATSGPDWQSGLLRSAFERTTTATEFGGRCIDVMVSPRALIETGGLP